MDSWGSSYYQGSSAHQVMPPSLFHSFHRPLREKLLEKPNMKIQVYCNPDDPWHIVGWIAFESLPDCFILHYVYVKDTFRLHGIGRQLLSKVVPASNRVVMTHLTYSASKIMGTHYHYFQRFKYVPHAL